MGATDSPSGGRPSVLRSKRRDPPIKQIPGIAKNSTRRKQEMATTQTVQEKELVHYRVEGGIAVLARKAGKSAYRKSTWGFSRALGGRNGWPESSGAPARSS